jgi:hypothetical protein
MSDDDPITKLALELDEWLEQNQAALSNTDEPQKALEAYRKGAQILKSLDAQTTQCISKIQSVIDDASLKPDDARVEELVEAFKLGARFKAVLKDELGQTDTCNHIIGQLNAIATALDKIGGGRGPALAPLLDDSDLAIGATAGAYLVELMPDRVVPLLHRIADEAERGSSAAFTAYWAYRGYELDKEKK